VEGPPENDRPRNDYWKVTVTDQGRGIPDETKRLVSRRHLESAKGSGLGLSIVRALVVDRYSGVLDLKNRIRGDYTKGTSVEIWLPRAK
jgi:signal transduction histidine kinase